MPDRNQRVSPDLVLGPLQMAGACPLPIVWGDTTPLLWKQQEVPDACG